MSLHPNQSHSPNFLGELWERRWVFLALSAVVSVALGYWGFHRHFDALDESRSFWTLFYLTLQLFVLESGGISGDVPWQLNVARFLAPVVAGSAAVAALLVIFRDQVESLMIGRMAGHVIICGLGEKGSLLVRSLRQRGMSVVAVERDADNDFIEAARLNGARVVFGDARSEDVLRRAGARRARYLIAVCGDDSTNAEIALQARSISASRPRGALTCSAHIVDPRLCLLLRRQELAESSTLSFRLDFFNVFESGARAFLRELPPVFTPAPPGGPHLLVVGLGHLGESLVVQATRTWRDLDDRDGERLRVTIVDQQAELKTQLLAQRHLELAAACDLIPHQISVDSPEFERAAFLGTADQSPDVGIAYVCVEGDGAALSAALTLHQRLRRLGVPVVVALVRSGGLGGLLEKPHISAGFERLHAFGLLDRTLNAELLLGGTYETIARAMHDEYVRQQTKEGQTPETNSSMAAWDDLPDSLKESNRAQAAHIGEKLRAAGATLVPLMAAGAEAFEFSPDEIELLAEMEHDRWVEERRRDGWIHAPGEKDIDRKTTPHMIPWDELSDQVKEWDRVFIRGLPRFLARVGLQIVRLSAGRPEVASECDTSAAPSDGR